MSCAFRAYGTLSVLLHLAKYAANTKFVLFYPSSVIGMSRFCGTTWTFYVEFDHHVTKTSDTEIYITPWFYNLYPTSRYITALKL